MYINVCLTFCIVLFYFFFNVKNTYPGVGRESCETVQYLSPFKCDCLLWRMPGASNTPKHMAGLRRSRLPRGAELMAPHAFHLKIWTTIQSKWILSSWSEPHSVCVERLERTLRCPYFITMTHSAAIIPVRYSTMLFLACFFSFSCNFSSAMHKTQWLSRRSC